MIGSQTKIKGELTGDEDIEIAGRVEGTINLKKGLTISSGAQIEATVHAKTVTIAGHVRGDVSADERVELLPSGSLEGNIRGPRIVISEGAHFRGSVDMSGKAEIVRRDDPARAPVTPPKADGTL